MMTWVEKYRPKRFFEFKGQNEVLRKIILFLNSFKNSKNPRRKKAILLYGPPGVGKTTIAHIIANETNSEIFELNASDFRNKTCLQKILKPVLEQKSLTKTKKIILIDEADGLSGYYDYGGISELIRLIDSTNYPIIITANDAFSKKLAPLRKKVEIIKINNISKEIILEIIFEILRKENLTIDKKILENIALNAKGDIRAAINDLQSIARTQKPELQNQNERKKEVDIFEALKKIFKNKPTKELINLFDSVNMPIDKISLWIEENIPKEYSGEALAKAYSALSKADLFKGRIYKKQYWRFLVYQNIFLSYAIASSKKEPNTNFTHYHQPERILKIWLNNQRTFKKKSIAEKYAKYAHISKKRAMNEFPIIKRIILSNQKIQKQLKLNEDEIKYLLK